MLPTSRSAAPWDLGWYGVEKRGTHPTRHVNSRINEPRKYFALSIIMDSGTPVSVHVFIKASAMFFADNERKGYANGKDVAESHNTIK